MFTTITIKETEIILRGTIFVTIQSNSSTLLNFTRPNLLPNFRTRQKVTFFTSNKMFSGLHADGWGKFIKFICSYFLFCTLCYLAKFYNVLITESLKHGHKRMNGPIPVWGGVLFRIYSQNCHLFHRASYLFSGGSRISRRGGGRRPRRGAPRSNTAMFQKISM